MKKLFGYYRQFDELSPEEVSAELLARRDSERARHPVEPPPPRAAGLRRAPQVHRRRSRAPPDEEPAGVRRIVARHAVEDR